MTWSTPQIMQAAAIDQFGGTITPRTLPVPQIDPDELLIRVESAGVGGWDPFEKEGGFAKMMGVTPRFPYVLGSGGAGTVGAGGGRARGFKEGDRVFAVGLADPK